MNNLNKIIIPANGRMPLLYPVLARWRTLLALQITCFVFASHTAVSRDDDPIRGSPVHSAGNGLKTLITGTVASCHRWMNKAGEHGNAVPEQSGIGMDKTANTDNARSLLAIASIFLREYARSQSEPVKDLGAMARTPLDNGLVAANVLTAVSTQRVEIGQSAYSRVIILVPTQ